MATISTPEYLLDQAKRRFTPSINNFPGMGTVEKQLLATDFPQHALAEPPAGSDLKPVMGDAGLPVLGHMVEMFRGGPEYLLHLYRKHGPVLLRDSPVAARGHRAGPRRQRRRSTPTATRTTRSRAGSRSSGRSSTAA